jgi:hypothetical protein
MNNEFPINKKPSSLNKQSDFNEMFENQSSFAYMSHFDDKLRSIQDAEDRIEKKAIEAIITSED